MKFLIYLVTIILLIGPSVNARDLRAVRIEKFLQRYEPNSPLLEYTDEIVECADKFDLDYRLYVAISGAESGFGRAYPKSKHNLTGILNGATGFNNIFHNIYYTHKLIGTRHWYKKYRKTKKIEDLVYVYKCVPPFDHYIYNMRFALDGISRVVIDEEKAAKAKRKEKPEQKLIFWNQAEYDKYKNHSKNTLIVR
ncbi:hypothetical protein ACFL52_00920 [Candidatus Margulisiibacteriota bacterium]